MFGSQKLAIISMWIILTAGAAHAAEWADLVHDCGTVRSNFGFGSIKSCATDLFTAHPVHLTAEPVVPGGGTAIALTYTHLFNRGRWQRDVTLTAGSSLRQYWIADGVVTMAHPRFGGEWNTARDSFQLKFYGRARGLPQLPFYGIGPNTTQAGLVDYSERDVSVGATVFNPLKSWFAVGGVAEGLWPDIGFIGQPSVRSIEQLYGESTAPGLTTQPTYTHIGAFLNPRYERGAAEFSYRFGYYWYHDTDSNRYSFGRFRADMMNRFFFERHKGVIKRDSIFYIHGRVTTSVTGNGSVVPFYLQETLGGSDIDNEPTLRGFRDYRFRGPNLLLIQAQFERRIWGPLGLMLFYDTGKVTTRKSDIDFADMRHSFGGGVTFWTGSKVVFRAYVGLGSGEGHHTFFGIPNLSGTPSHL
jgi:hypothetical protein